MRSLAAVLILAGFAVPPQEDLRIRALLDKLDDDSIEARAAAASSLIELGAAALPSLRRAVVGAGVELKDRLTEVIRKIQDRERLSTLLPPLSRITLQATNLPLREVLENVAKQTTTAIDVSEVPEDARVTVSLAGVPLWKALDEICRANGKAMIEIRPDRVAIVSDDYVRLPGKITDLFSVALQRIDLSTEVTFGSQERYDHFSARFQVAWGRSARPYYLVHRIVELVDEEGNQLIAPGEELEPPVRSYITPDTIGQDILLETTRGLGPQATKIAKFHVEVELEFPLKYAEAKIDLSGGKVGGTAECAEFAVNFHRFERQDGALTAALIMTPRATLEGEVASDSIVLRDKAGREYPAIVTEGSQANENETPYQLNFPTVPENAELVELVIRIPTEVHRERIDLDLKDLSLK